MRTPSSRTKSSRTPSSRAQSPRPSPITPKSLPQPALYAVQVAVAGGILAITLLAGEALQMAIDFASGVLTLVSLSAAVIWGLVAADRVLLEVRQRLLSQAIHRGLAVASLGFLLMHITVKVAEAHASLLAALVPFSLGVQGSGGLIGLGSLAAHCMVIAGATGAARSRLASNGPAAARWRALHSLAYPAWFAALLHGLNAGRPAAVWVTTMYALALAAVGAAVSVRLLPQPQRRRIARLLMSLTKPGPSGRADRDQEPMGPRDTSVSPLPGGGAMSGADRMPGAARMPGGRADTFAEQPPLRLDSTRPTPVAGGRGAGISAAYRAVSSPPPSPFGAPAAPQEARTEMLPPMPSYEAPTDILPPVPSGDPQTGGVPPVPQYDTGTLPPVPQYGTGNLPPVPQYDTGNLPPVPQYDTGNLPPVPQYDTGNIPPVPQYDTGGIPQVPQYDTGNLPPVPQYDTGNIPPVPQYDTGGIPQVPQYDTGNLPPVPPYQAQTGNVPPLPQYDTGNLPPVPQYDTGGIPSVPSYAAPTETFQTVSPYVPEQPTGSSGRWPAPSPPPPGETFGRRAEPDPAAGQSYSPPPGEPWHQPAGERP
ncbi:hypothetical protein ACFYYR_02125 [Streptomyces sp. NPDC001922]|uniref:hypothetical protein n=1 Tax=Streptomyces sp. NPDC001922 TaxID=3364624 RepID=UPI0036CEB914